MSQNNIKTILSVDDKDVKSKLEGLKKYYSDTFKSWASSTAETKHATMELSLAQTRLTKARYEVAAATAESGRVSKEELKTLNAEVTASRSAVAAAKQRVSASKEATAAMWMEMEASKKAQSALNDGTRARNESNKSLEQNWNQLIRVARWAGTLIGVYYGLKTAWDATLGKGIELGRQIEDMGMGISALTAANTSNISILGQVLSPMDKFRMATVMTTDTMKQLRKAAIDTPASFAEISAIFQQAFVSTSKMGNGFGLTVKDITKNTVELATRMSNIAGAIGMPMQKALEETRSLMSGQASGDSLIASLLFGSPAKANSAMRKAQEDGPLGVKKMLDGVMKSFDVLAGVDTYTKSLAQAKGAYENLITKMAEPAKSDLQELFKDIAKQFDETTAVGEKNIDSLTEKFDKGFKQMKVSAGVAWDIASIFTTALKNIETASDLTFEIIGQKIASSSKTAQTNFNFFDYAILGFASISLAGKTAFNYLELEAKRSAAVIQKYWSYTDVKQYMPIVEKDKWNGKNIVTTVGTKTRAKLDLEIAGIDAEMKGRVNTDVDEIIGVYKSLILTKKEALGKVGGKDSLALSAMSSAQREQMEKYAEAHKSAMENAKQSKDENLAILKSAKEELATHKASVALTKEDVQLKNALIASAESNVKMAQNNVRLAEMEISKLNDKASSKAEVAANKAMRQEVSRIDIMNQAFATEMRGLELIDARKELSVSLDESRLKGKEKAQINHYEKLREEYRQNIVNFQESSLDTKTKEYQIDQELEKLRQNEIDLLKYKYGINVKITEETERQSLVADKLSRAQFRGSLKELSRSAKSPETQSEFERIFGKDKLPRTEAYGLIEEAKTKYRKETFSITDPEQREKVREDLNKFVDGIKSKIVEIPDIEIKFKLFGGDELTRTFMTIADTMDTINDKTKEYDLLINEAKKSGKDSKKLEEAKAQSQILGYGQIASAMSSMFAQGSREAEAFRTIEGGLAIVAGVQAILTQGSGDPYTAFARIAAMSALVASTLQSAGIAFGGAGGTSTSYDAFASQAVNTGTGSVLGDTKTQSESITNSLELLSDLAKPEFQLMSQMNTSLLSINQKIGGLSAKIVQAGGFATGEGYIGSSSQGSAEQFMSSGVGGLLTGGASTALLGMAGSASLGLSSWAAMGSFGPIGLAAGVIDNLLLGGTFTKLISGAIGGLVSGIFGGDIETSLHDAGISFSNQLITAAITGLEGQSYQVAKVVEDGGWFSGDDESYNSYFSQLDEYTRKQFQLVLGNLYDTTVMAGEGLDTSATLIKSELSDFVVDIGKISLKDKTGEEIQATLTAIFGKIGDSLASEAFPALIPFQKIGEGLFETMTRVVGGMEEAEYYINRLGMAFNDVTYSALVNKQGDVAVEALTQSIVEFDTASYGVNNGVVQIVKSFNGTAEELFTIYGTLEDLRTKMIMIGSGAQFLTSEMIKGAGGVNELGDAMTSFFDLFMNDSEKLTLSSKVMLDEFNKLDKKVPIGVAGFKTLVNSIDLTTASGQELYGRVLLLSEGFSELITQSNSLLNAEKSNALELAGLQRTLVEEQKNTFTIAIDATRAILNSFTDLIRSIEGSISGLLGTTTGTSQRDLISSFWDKRAQLNTILAKNGNLTSDEVSQMQSLVGELTALGTSIQGASVGSNASITQSLIGELENIKEELRLDEKILTVQIVDAGGTVVNTSTEGTLTLLASAIAKYNANIEASLQVSSGGLTFEDFKAGGMLTTSDEIAFRQSFTAESSATYKSELDALRENLSFMTLSTTDIAGFLNTLQMSDSVGFTNVVEFLGGLGVVPSQIGTAFDTLRTAALAEVASAKASASYWDVAEKWVSNLLSFSVSGGTGDASTSINSLLGASVIDEYVKAAGLDIMKYITTSMSNSGYAWATYDTNAIKEALSPTIIGSNVTLAQAQELLGGLPSFDVGSPYLPSDMVAQVHQGEMIVDAQSSNVLRKYGISSNDYLSPVMNKIYHKLDEMAGYMNRLDRNIDSAMQGRALRTVV